MMENHKNKLMMAIEEYWRKDLLAVLERKTRLKIETDLINDVIGPRRSGKTYLMFFTISELLGSGIEKEATIYLNFENRKLLPLTPEYFNHIIELIYARDLLKKHEKIYLFLDEVQRIDGWERYVRSIYDEFKGRIKIFLSGSTSRLTKSELSYLLTGRHLTTFVFPLSFEEFLSFKNFVAKKPLIEEDVAKVNRYLEEYMAFGGFPEVVLTGEEKGDILETLFSDIINRDIAPRAKKSREVVEEIAYFLSTYTGKPTSFSKLAKVLKSRGTKISVPTLEKYFNHTKEAFLFFDLKVFSYKIKDQLQHPKKIYAIDSGLANFSSFKISADYGRVMENLVAVELLRRTTEPKKEVYYWKDYTGKEVDFLVKEGPKVKQLIQACYDISDPDTKKRETKSLLKASSELGCNNLLTITWDYEGEEEIKNKRITYKPLWKWLLAD